MTDRLKFALVAHDACKPALVDWATKHASLLEGVDIYATGTTGGKLQDSNPKLNIHRFKSGPLGGDQQIGALICEGKLDALIFFIDPLSPMPHDVDVKALTRLAIVYDLPMASSPATANFIVQALCNPPA
ncbi:methylglyoxal synthase [Cognatishimia maritima]|uniref:Methylglyoxal synthase n=1 Tax=Cognatishimia maritima TaxID=870908 RepID=A0A1M5QG29_9RHOB|nr:methylglyoxal synthase [Cognatishimia maritima]SHH12821.1 methylglyoxal synthase [Cognatishimia maritima]